MNKSVSRLEDATNTLGRSLVDALHGALDVVQAGLRLLLAVGAVADSAVSWAHARLEHRTETTPTTVIEEYNCALRTTGE